MSVAIPNAKLRTRRTWLYVALFVWGLGWLLPLLVTMLTVPGIAKLLMLPFYFGGIVGLDALSRRWIWERSGALRADEHGVFLEGKLLVARKKLTHGFLVREGERVVLRLVPRGMDAQAIDVDVADEAQANELLASMHLDRTVAEYTMIANHKRHAWVKTGILLGGFTLLSIASVIAWISLLRFAPSGFGLATLIPELLYAFSLVGTITVATTREVDVAVGADGIWIRQRFVKKRFVSFDALVDVTQTGPDLTLTLGDGTTIELHQAYRTQQDTDNFVVRAQAGIAAFRAGPKQAGDAVARNGRTIAEWMRATSKQHERSANYRQPVIPQDQLWRIVEDAAAPATERAGAALALRADLSDDGKARLRIAAGACAEKKLRVALESVVTAGDEELARAMEPLEESPRARTMSRA